jgi:hypothetical protein
LTIIKVEQTEFLTVREYAVIGHSIWWLISESLGGFKETFYMLCSLD